MFDLQKPKHLQFYCMTDTEDAESCDLRLYKAALPPEEPDESNEQVIEELEQNEEDEVEI